MADRRSSGRTGFLPATRSSSGRSGPARIRPGREFRATHSAPVPGPPVRASRFRNRIKEATAAHGHRSGILTVSPRTKRKKPRDAKSSAAGGRIREGSLAFGPVFQGTSARARGRAFGDGRAAEHARPTAGKRGAMPSGRDCPRAARTARSARPCTMPADRGWTGPARVSHGAASPVDRHPNLGSRARSRTSGGPVPRIRNQPSGAVPGGAHRSPGPRDPRRDK